MLAGQDSLLGLILRAHRLGVAARRLGVLELFVLDRQELGAQALDLFLGGRAHIGGGDHRAEPPRRGDGLQTRHAHAHDEDLGGGDGARRRHHHREALAKGVGRLDHRAIAGQIGLGRQHVHDLGAGDARHEFHGEGGDVGALQRLDRILFTIGVQHGDDHGAGLERAGLLRRRAAHLQHDVGAVQHRAGVGLHRGPGLGIVGVRNGRADARPGLDRDGRAQGDQLLHRLRRYSATRLAFTALAGHGDGDSQANPSQVPQNRNVRTKPKRASKRKLPPRLTICCSAREN